MAWVSQPTVKRNSWKDMSAEMRMMFLYHICMMVLFASGGSIGDDPAISPLLKL